MLQFPKKLSSSKYYLSNGNVILIIIISIILIIVFTFSYKAYLLFESNVYSKCAVFLARGGGGDKGFNDLINKALKKIEDDLKVELNISSFKSDDQKIKDVSYFINQKFDLIIGVGFEYEELFSKLSRESKKTHFIIVDTYVKGKNVASLVFREHEGGFLAGAFAALVSNGNPIGFIGGMMVPPVERFCEGYVEGAKYINPNQKIEIRYVSKDASGFLNEEEAKRLATYLYKDGIFIIFHAAGAAGLGVINAAKALNKYVIGVDSDQSHLAPSNIVTSVEKRVDVVLYDFLNKTIKNKFIPGKYYFGIKENAIKLSEFDYGKFKFITSDVEKKIEQIQKDIINDRINILKNIKNLYD